MTTYAPMTTGLNLSQFVDAVNVRHERIRAQERGTTEPTVKVAGLLWSRTDYPTLGEAVVRWSGSAWTLLLDPDHAAINAGGTVAYTADQPMGGRVFTGLGAGSANGHSVRFEQVLLVSGANAMAGNLAMGGNGITGIGAAGIVMGGNKITGLGAPTSANDAARKADVDATATTVGLVALTGSPWEADVDLGFTPRAVLLQVHEDTENPGDDSVPMVLFGDEVAVGTERGKILPKWEGTAWSSSPVNIRVTRLATPVLGFRIKVGFACRVSYIAFR